MASIYADEYREIIKTLIRARKAAGITQQQLAAKLGQRPTFVSKFELGERRLDVAEFIRISQAIGADPLKIMESAEAPTNGADKRRF